MEFDPKKFILELKKNKKKDLTIILPCRNEEKALPHCLKQIYYVLKNNNIDAEIIISDSSTDKSPDIAKKFSKYLDIKLIKHNKEGYGNAYLSAFPHVSSEYVFMADADASYDFNEIPNFLEALKQNNDFIIGNRFSSKLKKEVMPWSHKYIGNPVLSGLLRLLYKTKIKDCHCGMRAIKTDSLKRLNLQTTGMEFASEMIVKALKNNLIIKQISITYKERIGKSKLKTISDGWRHLRFMLLYSPLFLFFIPGLFLFLIGISSLAWFYLKNPEILGFTFYIHPMFLSSILTLTGYQLVIFSAFAKTYSITHLKEKNPSFERLYKYITIERASILGILIILIGLLIYTTIFTKWMNSNFGELNEIKNSIIALTIITLGIQTIFSSFMLSILGIKEK